jgi:nucleotidyltransferase substrate binding protein (TIGR01987 family)
MKKFDNFCKALDNLKQIYDYSEPYNTVTETGLVALFSICFEQSWKAMKEILEIHGYDSSKTGSPKMIIKVAYSAGMIKDEDGWLNALSARNDVTHSYNEQIALGIINNAKNNFITLFENLKTEILENWI